NSTTVKWPRRRGDRVKVFFAAVHESGSGTQETLSPAAGGSVHRGASDSICSRRVLLSMTPNQTSIGDLRRSDLRYSMTSSACACNVNGTARPSAWAVFRLMTSSYFVGC